MLTDQNLPLAFRPIREDDGPLLRTIYFSTREEEMALLTHWPEEAKHTFLEQQFMAQHTYYQQQYYNADYQVIIHDDTPAGRLYIDYGERDILIIDIAILPAFRNLGIGTIIIQNVLKEATSSHRTVSIHVEKNNRAIHLYRRMGFEMVDDTNAVYYFMKWKPNT